MNKTFILFGYYGFNNIGDEQLLDESFKLLKTISPNCPIIIANGPNPAPFNTFKRTSILNWWHYLNPKNTLVFGGGSIFQSHTSTRSLFFYLTIIILAIIKKTPVILMCQGWGPFKKKWHEVISKKVLSQTNIHRSWRDQDACDKFGASSDPTFCDLVLTETIESYPERLNDQSIGLCIRKKDLNTIQNECAKAGKHITQIICDSNKPNTNQSFQLQNNWNNPAPIGILITDRYHCAIWASKFGIPWIVIGDDPKLITLATSAHQSHLNKTQANQLPILIEKKILNHACPILIQWHRSHYKKREQIQNWLTHELSI